MELTYFIDKAGNLYCGDMEPGDREATADETDQKRLKDAREARLAALDMACKAAILTGFASSALGTPHTYPAKDTDQANLQASVLSSMYPNLLADWTTPFWCADDNGSWAMRPHTAAQIQQVGVDGKAAIIAAVQRKAAFEAEVMAATTIQAVQAVTWGQA